MFHLRIKAHQRDEKGRHSNMAEEDAMTQGIMGSKNNTPRITWYILTEVNRDSDSNDQELCWTH